MFGHDTGVVVGNLALVTFVDVNVAISGLDFVSGGSNRELIDSAVLSPTVSNADITLDNFTLWFLKKECIEVILDGIKVFAGHIRKSRQQHGAGLHGIWACNNLGIASSQFVVPQTEQSTNFVFRDVFSSGGFGNFRLSREEASKSNVQFGRTQLTHTKVFEWVIWFCYVPIKYLKLEVFLWKFREKKRSDELVTNFFKGFYDGD